VVVGTGPIAYFCGNILGGTSKELVIFESIVYLGYFISRHFGGGLVGRYDVNFFLWQIVCSIVVIAVLLVAAVWCRSSSSVTKTDTFAKPAFSRVSQ